MITCVALNAAVDRTYVVPGFTAGQIHRVEEVIALPGGKGINVARVIRALGGEALATGFVGGSSGRFIEEHLGREGIHADFVRVDSESRHTVTIIDPAQSVETGLYERGPYIDEADWKRLKCHLRELARRAHAIILSGSLPRGLDTSAYRELIEIAGAAGRYVVLDTSGGALKEGLMARPSMVKPNCAEAAELLGRPLPTLAARVRAVRTLLASGQEAVGISCGAEGTVAGYRGRVWQVAISGVTVKSSVGAGDAFVAGFVFSWLTHRDFPEALRFATACAAADVMTVGAGVLTLRDVRNLEPGVTVERLE